MAPTGTRLIDTGLRVPFGVYDDKFSHPALIHLGLCWLYGRQQRRYLVMLGDRVSGYAAKFGSFQAEEIAIAGHLCRCTLDADRLARSTTIDAGCHMGNDCVELGPLLGSVLAIDAVASHAQVASANLAWNDLEPRPIMVCAAVSDRETVAALHAEREGNLDHAGVITRRHGPTHHQPMMVLAVPLNTLVQQHGLAVQTVRAHAPILQIEAGQGNRPSVQQAFKDTGIVCETWQVACGNPLHHPVLARLWSALCRSGNPVYLQELRAQMPNSHDLPCVLFVPAQLQAHRESMFPMRERLPVDIRKDVVPMPLVGRVQNEPLRLGLADATSGTRTDNLVVVILTRNEEQHLPRCLESARFAKRIVVVDAGSTDRTIEIARAHGAEVALHDDWQGFGVQRTRALMYCEGVHYIFFLDADEVITTALQAEISAIVASGETGAWMAHWVQVAFGQTLTGVTSRPGMPRLFHTDSLIGFEGAVHEEAIMRPDTVVRRLKHPLLHYSYDSVQASLGKIKQYALLGASKRAAQNQRGGVLRGLASALSVFLRLYFGRRAFLHGGPGFLYCYVLAQECFFRYAALEYDREQLTDRIER